MSKYSPDQQVILDQMKAHLRQQKLVDNNADSNLMLPTHQLSLCCVEDMIRTV